MQKLSKATAAILDTLTVGLESPYTDDGESSRKIGKKGDSFTPVSVERIGNTTYSVCHYIEMNGDLVQDPEMMFKKMDDGSWIPLAIQQFVMGGRYRESVVLDGNEKPVKWSRGEYSSQRSFATMWMKNIKEQQNLTPLRQQLRESVSA